MNVVPASLKVAVQRCGAVISDDGLMGAHTRSISTKRA